MSPFLIYGQVEGGMSNGGLQGKRRCKRGEKRKEGEDVREGKARRRCGQRVDEGEV